MKLEDYISETIRTIAIGISKAQRELDDLDVIVNPPLRKRGDGEKYYSKTGGSVYPREIEISASIALSEGDSGKASLGVFFAPIKAGVEGGSQRSSESSGSVKFTIPVVFPAHPGTKETSGGYPLD